MKNRYYNQLQAQRNKIDSNIARLKPASSMEMDRDYKKQVLMNNIRRLNGDQGGR